MSDKLCSHCREAEVKASGACERCLESYPPGYFPIPSPVKGGVWEWFDSRWIFTKIINRN